jgi:hypothetical protein
MGRLLRLEAFALAGLAGLMGCSEGRKAAPLPAAPPPAGMRMQEQSFAARPAAPAPEPAARAAPQPAASSATQAMQGARKLIRRGQLAVQVADFTAAAESAARIAEGHGGYVADTQTTRQDNGKRRGQLTVRVAATRFDAAFASLKTLGRVDSETINTEDITKAYADLETRLRVKRDAEARIREILRGRAAKLSEVLEAERELSRLIEEIETMEGERRFYDQQLALSTITLQLYEPEAMVRSSLLEPIREALRGSLETLAESVAALIGLLIFATPWIALLWLVWRGVRAWRRRARKAKSVSTA